MSNLKPAVIFCNPSFLPVIGGIENWIVGIVSEIAESCDVYVVTQRLNNKWLGSELLSEIHVIRYSASVPKYLPSRIVNYIRILKIYYIVREISKNHSSVVFNFFDPRYEHVYAAGLLKLHNVVDKVFCTLAGTVSEQAEGRLKNLSKKYSDQFIAISYYAAEAFGLDKMMVKVIYPIGSNFSNFSANKDGWNYKQVLTVCRVHPRKNLEYLIDVAHRLPDISFVIVGDYTLHEEYYQYLNKKIENLNVHNVRFTGQVDAKELKQLYKQSTLFFLPTSHEMYGLVFAEALSYGLPVVAPKHTAIPEAMDSQCSILYQPDNLEECVSSIQEIVDSWEYWKNLSEGARVFMERRYSENYYGQYAQALLHALNESRQELL